MVELLQSQDCVLPCYLGISPGKTLVSEAQLIMRDIGAFDHGDYVRKGGLNTYNYMLWVGDPSAANETPSPDGSTVKIYNHIALIASAGTVQGLGIDIIASKSMAKFRQYWSRYSTSQIFEQIGKPDHLYIGHTDPFVEENGRALLIEYDKQDVLIEFYGTSRDNNVCPELEARYIDLRLSLYNPNSGLSFLANGRVPPTDRSVWLPVEEALGITTKEFYNRVISDPSTCFKPKVTTP